MNNRNPRCAMLHVLTFLAAALAIGPARGAPQVDVFTPQGEAKNVRQVSVRFSEPVVAFGDPRLPDPFTVRCEGDPQRSQGRGRWADTRNWTFDFDSALPAGLRCRFALRDDFKAHGQALQGQREFAFHTGGPAALASLPRERSESIDEEQAFVLALDAPLDSATLNGAWCEAAGVNERIPVRAIPEKELREILNANRYATYHLFTAYTKGQREVPLARFKVDDKRWKDLPIVGVRCAQRLPAAADAALVLGPDVKTRSGVARGTPQRLVFKVRPSFTVKLTCQRINKDAACLPITPIAVDFNAPVPLDAAAGVRLEAKGGRTYRPSLPENATSVQTIEFKGPFPERTSFTLALPRGFKDDAGREPENKAAFPLETATDEFPPLAKFPARFGILELNAQPLLPVTVRNVEATLAGRRIEFGADAGQAIPGRSIRLADEAAIIRRFRDFERRRYEVRAEKELKRDVREGEIRAIAESESASTFDVPRAHAGKEVEVIGIPLPKPGFYIVELESPRLGQALHGEEDKPYFVSTSVLVTNLSVHLKHGRESSLVWVTSLDRGKPVGNARVSVRDCTGRVHFEGTTDASGIALAADRLPPAPALPDCGDGAGVLFAFARLGEDVAFTQSSWNEGIQPWNFNLRAVERRRGPVAVHTIFDRPLFRAGETVSMKHVARVPDGSGFRMPAAGDLPKSAEIEHVGSGQRTKLEARFDASGIAESTWPIPQEAKLGTYRVLWSGADTESDASFRVEAFRVPLMRAVLAPPKDPLVKPSTARIDAAVTYLSGGPASNLPVKMRYRVEERTVRFPDYPDFRFGGKPVKTGTQPSAAADAWDTFDPEESSADSPAGRATTPVVRTLGLDAAGTAKLPIDKLPTIDRPADLLVEMEYSDPNGEILAAATRVPLHPAALYVGIKPEGWAGNRKDVRAQLVVLDTTGKPLPNHVVAVDVYERKTYSNRRRLVGGFYAYDTSTEVKRTGTDCSVRTDASGLAFCALKPRASGELVLLARAKDSGGRESYASGSVWLHGGEEGWFEPENHDRIDLIPEKKRYEPGESARFQVRMPFREATVLVTAEREGCSGRRSSSLDGKAPTIDVPVLGHYGPNVYVSALALRGRVDPEVPGPYAWLKRWIYRVGYWLRIRDEIPVERDTRPTALVDLAKPAYKLGMAEIKVGRADYALNVKVTPEHSVLKVRESTRVAIEVADSNGVPASNGEIVLAAVDEGLLELLENRSWNILEGILHERPAEVMTATAQGLVIGKRHFGKKAVAAGGGGGRGGARELFDTLLLWKARVPLDAQGRAVVEIPTNDALTSFRIVAVAHAGASKFGHGAATVRTAQDLMMFAGLPPLVREQDEFNAMFTVRNATAQPVTAKFEWVLRDRPTDNTAAKTLASGEEALALAANEAKVLSIPAKVPVGLERIYWDVSAAGSGGMRDRLRVSQKVVQVHPVRVYQATLARLDKPLALSVERPAGAMAGRGGVRVDVLPSLGGELSAVREYFQAYPYTCLEQRVSKAIGLDDPQLWNAIVSSLPSYLDRDGLTRYFPSDTMPGSDVLTAYLMQIAHERGREFGEALLGRMLNGLEAFATGRIARESALPAADLTIRKLAAIEALSRHGRAKPAMLDSIAIDPALWPTSALLDWIGILNRVEAVPRRAERFRQALELLRARLDFQGTVMTFSTERNDALWWLMVNTDVNASRALIAVLDEAAWKDDVPRLVRGMLSRQVRGRWSTTPANAWGSVALARFSESFEKTVATGNVVVAVGPTSVPIDVKSGGQTRDIDWPAAREPLTLTHKGAGAPWAMVQSRAALPLTAPVTAGYSIKRTVTPVEQKDRSGYTRGDVYRVTLEIDAQSDMTWVVVDDPIPSGSMILGSGLARDAASLTQAEKRAGVTPAFIERTQEAYRAYYQFVPRGRFKTEYTVRLNNPGRFDLPATRVEALYAPEMMAELPNQPVTVKP